MFLVTNHCCICTKKHIIQNSPTLLFHGNLDLSYVQTSPYCQLVSKDRLDRRSYFFEGEQSRHYDWRNRVNLVRDRRSEGQDINITYDAKPKGSSGFLSTNLEGELHSLFGSGQFSHSDFFSITKDKYFILKTIQPQFLV